MTVSQKINTMNMLWGFDFNLAKDDAGEPIPIDLNDTTDVGSCLACRSMTARLTVSTGHPHDPKAIQMQH